MDDPDCSQEGNSFMCDKKFSFGKDKILGRMIFEETGANPEGLILRGSFGDSLELKRNPSFAIHIREFQWWPEEASCNGVGGMAANTDISVINYGIVSFCSESKAIVIDDSLNQFKPFIRFWERGSPQNPTSLLRIFVQIPKTEVKEEYLSNPYPLKMLIQTTAGARYITVPPFKRITDEEAEKIRGGWEKAIKSECNKLNSALNKIRKLPHPPRGPLEENIEPELVQFEEKSNIFVAKPYIKE